jgi:hypothetical protein
MDPFLGLKGSTTGRSDMIQTEASRQRDGGVSESKLTNTSEGFTLLELCEIVVA